MLDIADAVEVSIHAPVMGAKLKLSKRGIDLMFQSTHP